MIGDLISILFLVIIWVWILKIKKTDFSRFILEIAIYFFAFVFTLIFYKLFFGVSRFLFPEELYPSIAGIFAASLVFVYAFFKAAIFLIARKKAEWDIENKIYLISVRVLNFINPTDQDFQKVFLIFAVINFIIIGSLSNSVFDAFTFKKRLYVENETMPPLLLKEQKLISGIQGNDNFKYNIAKSIEFIRLTNPYYYEQIIENTERISISPNNMSMALASANPNNYTITFDPKYGQRRYDKIKEYLALGTILVHESRHLKDFKMIDSGKGFNFFAYIFGSSYFQLACNPITNYENFSQIFRAAMEITYDEWCAQIEEVKFTRMYNVDHKNDPEFRDIFSR